MTLPFPFGAVNRAIEAFFGEGEVAEALRALAGATQTGTQADDRLTDILFGLGTLGDLHITSNTAGFSGLKDCKTFKLDAGVTLSPAPGQLLFLRARESIEWNGTWLADNVFSPNSGNLITFGSPAQSGGGGGGGGGDSGANFGNYGNSGNDGFGGNNGAGYQPSTGGRGGPGGANGVAGGPGTAGAPGAVDPFQQSTLLSEYPGVMAAVSGCVAGVQGQNGGQGGRGADVGGGAGNGGNSGNGGQNGGPAGGLIILAAPSIRFGSTAVFQAKGSTGDPGQVGQDGQPAPSGSGGGGGGGGGGGSGTSGGSGGIVLAYFATFVDGGAVFRLAGGAGAAGGAGGAGGAGDGRGIAGAAGGAGATGPAGSTGFFWPKKVLTV